MSAPGFSWSSVPTDLLLAELSRRDDVVDSKPQCGSKERGHYDAPLHLMALVLILFLSTLSCAFPLFSSNRATGKRQRKVVFVCQHFGTGVLISTAFVHLLPTAFLSLTDPCLPHSFSKGYKAFAGLIAMTSALVVVSLESYLTSRGGLSHSHGHHHGWESVDEDDVTKTQPAQVLNGASVGLSSRRERRPSNITLEELDATEGLMAGASPLPESTTSASNTKTGGNRRDSSDSESLDLEMDMAELVPAPEHSEPADHRPAAPATDAPHIPTPDEQKRLYLQCLLLEAGILFHSIFIGMALSVATGPAFVVFLVAVSFHQSFEGLALGSRIAAIHFPRSSVRPWVMVLAFGLTTPIGQAIGMIVHNMYDPRSQTGLLMVGFMNAISAGLLLFAGLVQLIAEDFLSEKSYKTLHGRRRTQAFLAVFGGAGLMAAVGALA